MTLQDMEDRVEYDILEDHQFTGGILNVIAIRIHQINVEKGWWPEKPDVETYATKIALIHSEVSEMLEGLRKDKMDDHLTYRTAEEVEAADILIRLFDYIGARDLDIGGAFIEKLTYNASREDHKKENREKEGGKKI